MSYRALGLVRSDEFSGLAARWLAEDLVDTGSVRKLTGHDDHDPWGLEALLAAAVSERASSSGGLLLAVWLQFSDEQIAAALRAYDYAALYELAR